MSLTRQRLEEIKLSRSVGDLDELIAHADETLDDEPVLEPLIDEDGNLTGVKEHSAKEHAARVQADLDERKREARAEKRREDEARKAEAKRLDDAEKEDAERRKELEAGINDETEAEPATEVVEEEGE